jgi:biotin carboxyl carrier protein
MKLEVQVGGAEGPKRRSVEVVRDADGLRVRLDDREIRADAIEVAEGTYSILLDGRSFEVRVQPTPGARGGQPGAALTVQTYGQEFAVEVRDPRVWRGRRGGVLEAEGRQHICAPMPGKVVRLLVNSGDAVEARQGLVVVEAMKMQNEIKSPKKGRVERVLVAEGQNVNAGEVLVVVA